MQRGAVATAATKMAIVASIACAEPAALDVVVDVDARSVMSIQLTVKAGGLDGEAFVDCLVPLGESAEPQCGLEGGSGRWTDPERFSFVLFGDPGVDVAVEIDGLNGDRSVTATRAVARLPADGERDELRLALFERTGSQTRCDVDLAPPPGVALEPSATAEMQTALTVADLPLTPGLELLVSVDGFLGAAAFVREPDGCRVVSRWLTDPSADPSDPRHPRRWCLVHPGSMVVGDAAADEHRIVASLCATSGDAGARIKVARVGSTGVEVRTLDLGAPLARVSMPRVVDLNGDGADEVVALVMPGSSVPSEVQLIRYDPDRDRTVTSPLGTFGLLAGGQPALPPLPMTGVRGEERLLVAGYPGPVGVFDGVDFDGVLEPGLVSTRAPVVIDADRQVRLQEIRGSIAVSTRLQRTADEEIGWAAVGTATAAASVAIPPAARIRMSVGLAPDGRPTVVFAVDGGAVGWTVADRIAVQSISVPGASGGTAWLLHVNLDGQSGTELIHFSSDSNTVRAVDAQGRPLEGWPLTLTGDAGVRRVVITDLEPAREQAGLLRSAEVVALTYRRLEVIGLGDGSYDRGQWPWPTVDGGARGRWSGPTDPLRSSQ